jgi:hypothetical protein
MTIKINSKFISVNGKRAGVTYAAGPWVAGVNPDLIKVRPRRNYSFPAEFRAAFAIENNSNGGEDYFEANCIRVLPGHPLYNEIKLAAQA